MVNEPAELALHSVLRVFIERGATLADIAFRDIRGAVLHAEAQAREEVPLDSLIEEQDARAYMHKLHAKAIVPPLTPEMHPTVQLWQLAVQVATQAVTLPLTMWLPSKNKAPSEDKESVFSCLHKLQDHINAIHIVSVIKQILEHPDTLALPPDRLSERQVRGLFMLENVLRYREDPGSLIAKQAQLVVNIERKNLDLAGALVLECLDKAGGGALWGSLVAQDEKRFEAVVGLVAAATQEPHIHTIAQGLLYGIANHSPALWQRVCAIAGRSPREICYRPFQDPTSLFSPSFVRELRRGAPQF
jgi:hypothetical protein